MNHNTYQCTVSQRDAGARLDVFLSEKMNVSRSKIQEYIEAGGVLVNGKQPKKAGDTMKAGYEVLVEYKRKERKIESKMKIEIAEPMRIVAQEKDYVVVEKPAGLLVHPTQAEEADTVFSRLVALYPEIAEIGESETRGGIVHRLDRDASGLLVVARTKEMFESLKKQFQERTVEKEYIVLVHGTVPVAHGTIDFAIGRGSEGRMAARPKIDPLSLRGVANVQEGKEALTEFFVERRFVRYTLLRVRLHTGRMHQIRVHMLAYNHPVVGDPLYLNKKLNRSADEALGRLFLHAERLCFGDLSGERRCYESPLPSPLTLALNDLT